MKKQLCSLLTALALAVGLLPSAARAAENAPSFADVPAAAWYADAVQYVYENGLMTGVSESAFAPDGTATRGQIVTILWRLAGSPVVNYAMRYADADEGAWYGEAVRFDRRRYRLYREQLRPERRHYARAARRDPLPLY